MERVLLSPFESGVVEIKIVYLPSIKLLASFLLWLLTWWQGFGRIPHLMLLWSVRRVGIDELNWNWIGLRHSQELYAKDFVIISESTKELCQKLTSWKMNLENKGLMVGLKKTKTVYSVADMGILISSGTWSCCVYLSGKESSSIFCSEYKLWVYKRCGAMKFVAKY